MADKTKYTSMQVEKEINKDFKKACVNNDITMCEVIKNFMREYVEVNA